MRERYEIWISALRRVGRLLTVVVAGCVDASNALRRVSLTRREVALYNCGIFPRASTERGQASNLEAAIAIFTGFKRKITHMLQSVRMDWIFRRV
jgi:hypothetical protein